MTVKRDSNAHIAHAHLTRSRPVLGLRGQRLGVVDRVAMDIERGRISHLELKTQWQTIQIPWSEAEFDVQEQAFRLRPGTPRD